MANAGGSGILGGIGFTMSLFVDSLAFADASLIDRGKIAVLMGAVAAAILGSVLILNMSHLCIPCCGLSIFQSYASSAMSFTSS